MTPLFAFVAATLLPGCQGLNLSLRTPESQVADMELTEQTDEGARVVTTVEVANPNRTVLPVASAYYRLEVEGLEPFSFTTVPGVALPSEASQQFDLVAAVATAEGESAAGRAYELTGYARYRPPGEFESVLYGSGWPLPKTRFDAEGTLGEKPTTQPGGTETAKSSKSREPTRLGEI